MTIVQVRLPNVEQLKINKYPSHPKLCCCSSPPPRVGVRCVKRILGNTSHLIRTLYRALIKVQRAHNRQHFLIRTSQPDKRHATVLFTLSTALSILLLPTNGNRIQLLVQSRLHEQIYKGDECPSNSTSVHTFVFNSCQSLTIDTIDHLYLNSNARQHSHRSHCLRVRLRSAGLKQ